MESFDTVLQGFGRVVEVRELGTKNDSAKIWRRQVKIDVFGAALEVIIRDGDSANLEKCRVLAGKAVPFKAFLTGGRDGKAEFILDTIGATPNGKAG